MWQSWINGILGVWLFFSAWLLSSPSAMAANAVIVGIIVAVLGFWQAVSSNGKFGGFGNKT
ncbi:MAG: SPW repeat protein [Verrucomicrobia bacterium]|nr:SPW repeat protein [Verrucomicrobiota bacterium]